MFVERRNLTPLVELIGEPLCGPERLEKQVRLHDELEVRAADRIADGEHPSLKTKLGDALDVKYGVKISFSHKAPPVSNRAERTNISASPANGSLLDLVSAGLGRVERIGASEVLATVAPASTSFPITQASTAYPGSSPP